MPSRRERLTSAVGPDGSGSKPGMECTQMPEKSGMDAALSLPLFGATACPKAGVAAAAATVNTARKSRHCEFMLSSLSLGFRQQLPDKATPLLACGWKGALWGPYACTSDFTKEVGMCSRPPYFKPYLLRSGCSHRRGLIR